MANLRVATYNIHKCIGIDRKYSPGRIAEVLSELNADVIALQEVICHSNGHKNQHQAKFIADELGMNYCLGENRKHMGGDYGNVTLTKYPIITHHNHDISVKKYEPRGCLCAEVSMGEDPPLHFVNLHMGTSFFERRQQVLKILSEHVLNERRKIGRRIVAGDFNEWTKGLTTRLFTSRFMAVDPKIHLGTSRTFPGIMPLLHLDHIYFDDAFKLKRARLHKSKLSLVASDHLPIAAEFEI
jgi:endonuclease/exonuclease/phosphatase family metal-dependent hydrolase